MLKTGKATRDEAHAIARWATKHPQYKYLADALGKVTTGIYITDGVGEAVDDEDEDEE